MKHVATISSFLFFIMVLRIHAQPAVSFSYSKADSVAALYRDHSLKDLQGLSQKLTSGFTSEHDKFRAIFKWVCDNITNDYYLFVANKEKRESLSGDELLKWNREFNVTVFSKLIDTRATVCTGYAHLIRELSLHAGLSCEVINGYGRNVVSNIGGKGVLNHTWNAVKLEDKWYLCDATWASGSIDLQQKSFVAKYSDVYFLTNPALFVANHYPQDVKWTLLSEYPSLQEFLDAPLSYVGAIRNGIKSISPSTFYTTAKKRTKATISVSGPPGLKERLSCVMGSSRAGERTEQLISENESRYSFGAVLYFKGEYAIHVLLDNEYLYSYHVTVK